MYVISKHKESGMWYVHQKGFSYVPVFGTFRKRRSDAVELAKMYNGLPHNVKKVT